MKMKIPATLLLAVMTLLLLAQTGAAQQGISEAQEARQALSSFPDAQILWYMNARRITNDALPRVVPPEVLKAAFDDIKKKAGFDLTSIHYVILGARFREDAAATTPPDVVMIVKGDFSADALLSVMKLAGQGMYREETYGTRTLNLFDFNKNKQPEVNKTIGQSAPPDTPQDSSSSPQTPPPGMPFAVPQVAVTALDANTLLFGMTPYVKAAIDAREGGQGTLRPEFLDLATRQPGILVSLVGEIPASVAKYLQMTGMHKNDEMTKLAMSIKRVQSALTMNATDFGLHAVVGTDTAEHARALSGMISMGLNILKGELERHMREDAQANRTKDLPVNRAVLTAVNMLTNTTRENEIQLGTSVPQATVAALVRSQNKPRTPAAASSTETRPTRRMRPRGSRRRK